MSDVAKTPTHHRLLSVLKAIGPYLREGQCQEGVYLFDCLAVCINDKKSPEKREFWGWWMELTETDSGFEANYQLGRYNVAGNWEVSSLPEQAMSDVVRTQQEFHQKLGQTLQERFLLTLSLHQQSVEFA